MADSGNQKPHINKTLRSEIIKRAKLKSKANKTKNPFGIKNYKKQRNYGVQLNKNAKLEYINNFDSSEPFWVKCKPYFSNKHSKADTDIILNEKGHIIFKNKEIANTFNEYFGSIVESPALHIWTEGSSNVPTSYTSDFFLSTLTHLNKKNTITRYINIIVPGIQVKYA